MKDLPKRNTLHIKMQQEKEMCTWASCVSADEMKCITKTALCMYARVYVCVFYMYI